MATINMHDAKTQLSDLVARAEAGEDIVIARRNRPVVRLVRVDAVPAGFGEEKQAGYDAGGLREALNFPMCPTRCKPRLFGATAKSE